MLTDEEKELEKEILEGKWVGVKNLEKEIKRGQKMARYTLERMKKHPKI